MISRTIVAMLVILTGILTFQTKAQATQQTDRELLGGSIEARFEGRKVVFPILKNVINADIQGDLTTVTLTQSFANPTDTPLHATYLFPINKAAAIFEMSMQVGDEIIQATIKAKKQAEKVFNQAKHQGKSAALLTQHRPNMFTQDIANLMPGLPITVTMKYTQTSKKIDGDYSLVIPLIVGPRYTPPTSQQQSKLPEYSDYAEESAQTIGEWAIAPPDYPPVYGLDIPAHIDPNRVFIQVKINGGMPIQRVTSPTHAINVTEPSPMLRHITLTEGKTIDNRDFELRYRLDGTTSQAGMLTHQNEQGGFFSMLLEPPTIPNNSDISPREMVFLLDCSGSMSGLPMLASKTFMHHALANMRPKDSFRIIRFSDAASELSTRPLKATPANIQRGIRYIQNLHGSGGTRMISGIQQALMQPPKPGTLRLVVFLTDGYIGNELEILQLLDEQLDSARLFAFGVGTSVNRYLLSEMSRVGRGFVRYMDPTERVESVVAELVDRLQSPVLTNISIDWGGLQPTGITPERIPDLFAGHSQRIQGRFSKPGTYTVKVHGMVNNRKAILPLKITLPEKSLAGKAVALNWARSAIADQMHLLTTPQSLRPNRTSNASIKEEVTELGLDFSLITKWTAFVAVSKKVYNPTPENTRSGQIPLPKVQGTTATAYGNTDPKMLMSNAGFTGHSTPEPQSIIGLLIMLSLFGWFLLYCRREESLI
jgi:Ca-activated chloride channel homolog